MTDRKRLDDAIKYAEGRAACGCTNAKESLYDRRQHRDSALLLTLHQESIFEASVVRCDLSRYRL